MKGLPNAIRRSRPLVHAITNYVTMDWVARGLLAAGARPVMARDQSEAAAVAGGADAVVLNLGTWSPDLQGAMLAAGRAANERGIPVVLDPVGAGGLASRTRAAMELLASVQIAAVRGNAGEVAALAGLEGRVRGVDVVPGSTDPALLGAARAVATRYRCIVAATGETDIVTDGQTTRVVRAGDPLLGQIPGAGCLASALVAAALAAGRAEHKAPIDLVCGAVLWVGLAGEAAASLARGPGSFAVAFLDSLSTLTDLPADRVAPPLDERLALYVLVNGTTPPDIITAILSAGTGTIQFREKSLPLPAQIAAATRIRDLCRTAGALFLINDRVDLALAVDADGVHLGQDDLSVSVARHLLGPQAVIGATCETATEARIATAEGADYIATGPIYATQSKADAGEPYGPAVVTRVREGTHLPVVGIGGIGQGGAAPVIAAGASGVAVISSVCGAPDPGAAARAILREILQTKGVAES